MKLDKRKKKWLLSGTAAVLVLAIGAGIWFGVVSKSEPVNVYCFNYIGMTEFWGDNQESYGPVTTDKIQTVVLSDTQTVTKVLVSEGDQVKEGDVLMTYDTTLSDLALERKRLDVEKKKLELQAAKEQLQKIKNMTPMDPNALNPPIPEPTIPDLGAEMDKEKDYVAPDVKYLKDHDGTAIEKAMVFWVRDGKPIDNRMLSAFYDYFKAHITDEESKPESRASVEPQTDDSAGDSNSDGGKEDIPGDGEEDTPNNGTGDTPGDGKGDTPGDGKEDTPGDGKEDTPGDGKGDTPGDGKEDTPGDGKEDTPGDGKGDTPNDGKEGTSDDGKKDPSANGEDQKRKEIENGLENEKESREEPTVLGIRCSLIGPDKTVSVQEGKAVTLPFTLAVDGWKAGNTVRWDFSPKTDGALIGSYNNGSEFVLSGFPKLEDGKNYTLTATYTYYDENGYPKEVSSIEPYTFTLKVEKDDKPVKLEKDFYVILKVTEDDKERGIPLIWQGVHVYCYDDDSFAFTLFDASVLEDYTLTPIEVEETEPPEIDFGSGYTAAEIAKMRSEQEKKIKEQELAMRMAEAEYKIMLSEVNNGQVCADFDGEVVSVITEEEARQEKRPLLKVSAGGGFYISGTVSELEKDNLTIGKEVTVNDLQTGMTYSGTIQSVGDFPSQSNGWNGMGNPNASYYPFTAFVDGSADLQAGQYASVSYSTGTGENGIYLENPFVRTENGQSYVFVRGQNGKLEKRVVTVGKSLWGSYTEIKSGLTEDDYIAFPYGKTVKEGAPTAEGDLNSLYMY